MDRTANMRSFIDKMRPKTEEHILVSSPLLLQPCGESVTEERAERETLTDSSLGAPCTLSKRRRKTPIADTDIKQHSTLTGDCLGAAIIIMSDDEVEDSTSMVDASAGSRKDVIASRSATRIGGDDQRNGWACVTCTYSHRAQERQYLRCAMCGSDRLALPSL